MKESRKSKASTEVGKLPPQAIDIEEAILGAMMLEKDALLQVSGLLKPSDFYLEKHSLIYTAILELFGDGRPVDILTVTQKLKTKGELELVGGAYNVTMLTERVNSSAHIEEHARIVAQYALKRDLIRLCSEIHQKCYDEQEDAFACKDMLDTGLSTLEAGVETSKMRSMREILGNVLRQIASAMTIPDGITGVPSGFRSIDTITGGWQNSDLIIIAARPAMGKTAFVVCSALNSAVRHDKCGAIFSLEMNAEQLATRMITSELDYLDLSTDKLRRGKITEEIFSAINKNINQLINSKIYIDDTPGLSIARLRSKAFQLKRKYGIKWIIVDYLQLMTADTKSKGNREQEISAISRGLKTLAKELDIPIIALSQLSRSVETRGDKRPQLSDLRESGAIEQDADLVAFLFRPEYYGILQDEAGNSLEGIGEFIIAKHRNGALDTVVLRFVSRKTKFFDKVDSQEPTGAFNFGYRKTYEPEDDSN